MEISKTDLQKVIAYLNDACKLYDALPMQSMKSRAHMIRQLMNKLKIGMNPIRHRLISDLSAEYADSLASDGPDTAFTRGDIAVAYIIGAEETLQRVCNIVRESAASGGITPLQSQRIIGVIELIENNPAAF